MYAPKFVDSTSGPKDSKWEFKRGCEEFRFGPVVWELESIDEQKPVPTVPSISVPGPVSAPNPPLPLALDPDYEAKKAAAKLYNKSRCRHLMTKPKVTYVAKKKSAQ